MSALANLLDQFEKRRVLVIGDLMLDEYLFGDASRISPEAPVMVLRHTAQRSLPGGAANVALNVRALGATSQLIGVVGQDAPGDNLRSILKSEGFDTSTVVIDPDRPTTSKTRIVAESRHQIVRIDHESNEQLSDASKRSLISKVGQGLESADTVLLSDYQKGVLYDDLAVDIVKMAFDKGATIVANAKPQSIKSMASATVTINRQEACEFLRISRFMGSEAMQVAKRIKQESGSRGVLITLGSDGMVFTGDHDFITPAVEVEVADPAGAGDTVAACVALGLASVGECPEVFQLAAQAAACTVRHVGVATPTAQDLQMLRGL